MTPSKLWSQNKTCNNLISQSNFHEAALDGLLNDIAKVSATSESIEKEVETSLGFSLLVKIAPYRTEQTDFNRDIVLTFSIVSLAKK